MLKDYQSDGLLTAGCDEAGRGCLAGPVVAAAVILPEGFRHPLLNDSKKMTEAKRNIVREVIIRESLAWATGVADHDEIDRINILNASFLAMHRAIDALTLQPGLLLIDGNRFQPYPGITHTCVVGGDGIYKNIAAASVIAKTTRDAIMHGLHLQYPQYGWDRNKAYATAIHREALRIHGRTPYHRRSFLKGIQAALEL
jgi:ribonuclease HII